MPQRTNFWDEFVQPIFKIDDGYQVIDRYEVENKMIVDLCGGVPVDRLLYLSVDVQSINDSVLRVSLGTDLFQAERLIDFNSKLIENASIHVFHKRKGIGTRLLCNQVYEARRHNFRKLTATAMGPDYGQEWMGYYTWGRLGYLMQPLDQGDFEIGMRNHGRQEKMLHELLATAEGRAMWLNVGFTWAGAFDLRPNSLSLKILAEYLKVSKKDYQF